MAEQFKPYGKIITSQKPLITIVGVLGKQGLSAALSLLESGRYRVRGITRRTSSPKALELTQMGAEIINIPLALGYKKDYIDAFRGAQGVFMMTPSITPPANHEFALGKELSDAAVEAGVEYLLFSSLENVDEISGGKLSAPHFTDKAKVEAYIRKLPIKSFFIYLSFFYTNLLEFYTPKLIGDTLEFPIYLPKDFKAPFVDPTTATGPAVLEIFSHPDQYLGKSLPVIGEILSPQQMVDTFISVTGRKAIYSPAFTREEMLRHFPAFAANEELVEELLGMVNYAVEYGYFRKDRDLNWSRKINPDALNWEQFLRTTDWKGEPWVF